MEQKYSKNVQKHIVTCPHCGGDVLDHMTQCIHCKGELIPKGYSQKADSEKLEQIKKVLFIIASVIAVAVVVWRVAVKLNLM